MSSPPRHIALALSGGNALGAYAAGAFEAMEASGWGPDVVSGASVGAVTGAIIAGNEPADRLDRLREFWSFATWATGWWPKPASHPWHAVHGHLHAMQTMLWGRPGLFTPRPTGFLSLLPGTPPDVALFDATPIAETLHRFIDFELLNRAGTPLIVSCVDVERGEPVWFDSRIDAIEPIHLLASTAFIPGFPPVQIGGRWLGDPGLYCNVPLDPLWEAGPPGDGLCLAVDLYDARGPRHVSMDTGVERVQDLLFGLQTLRAIDARRREQCARFPPPPGLDLMLLAYRSDDEVAAKSIDFSRGSVTRRWNQGSLDMRAAIDRYASGRPDWNDAGLRFFDCRRSP